MNDQPPPRRPWDATPPERSGFLKALWAVPWPIKAVAALILAGVVVAAIVHGGSSSNDSGHITKAQYDQWRTECEARATETLDTSLYRVGGNQWIDEVNRCLTAKAND